MFSLPIIQRSQDALEAASGLCLRRYSVEECQQWRRQIESLLDESGQLDRKQRPAGYTHEEAAFIVNEQLLCTIDFLYWAERYAYIVDAFGEKRLYTPNIAQRIFLDVLAEMEQREIALMIQALKARQLGITTISELIIAHRVTFHSVDAVVASSDPEKSAKMARIMELIWENMPFYLLPPRMTWQRAKDTKAVRYRAGELVVFPQINSAISIQWGNQTTGICRGATPKVAHLSELCDFENPQELVDASLIRAMHENPRMFLCLESTAKGKDNWWYDTWQFNKQNWPGAARLYPLFLPWYVGTDLYPSKSFLKKNPVPSDWTIPEHITRHAEKAERFVSTYPLLTKYLGAGWRMSLEQKWFYEVNRREYVTKGTLMDWFKEMPADDQECFQISGTSVIDAELLAEYRDGCASPKAAFIIEGPEVPTQLKPSILNVTKDPTKPVIPIATSTGTYKLLPIQIPRYPLIDFQNKVFLWELPEANEEYGIGVDPGEGVGKDSTAIQVIRKGTPDRHAAQVAEFVSNKINAYESWPLVFALANLYSTRINGEIQQAKVIVECAANGESIQMELRKRGWRKFHIRTQPSRRQYNLSQERLLGWKTDTMTRPLMLDFLLTALKERWLDVNSPELVAELDDLHLNEKRRNRIEHRPNKHDDRVFALGIALYSLHWNSIYRSPSPAWQERVDGEREAKNYPIWKPGVQEIDLDGPRDRHIRW